MLFCTCKRTNNRRYNGRERDRDCGKDRNDWHSSLFWLLSRDGYPFFMSRLPVLQPRETNWFVRQEGYAFRFRVRDRFRSQSTSLDFWLHSTDNEAKSCNDWHHYDTWLANECIRFLGIFQLSCHKQVTRFINITCDRSSFLFFLSCRIPSVVSSISGLYCVLFVCVVCNCCFSCFMWGKCSMKSLHSRHLTRQHIVFEWNLITREILFRCLYCVCVSGFVVLVWPGLLCLCDRVDSVSKNISKRRAREKKGEHERNYKYSTISHLIEGYEEKEGMLANVWENEEDSRSLIPDSWLKTGKTLLCSGCSCFPSDPDSIIVPSDRARLLITVENFDESPSISVSDVVRLCMFPDVVRLCMFPDVVRLCIPEKGRETKDESEKRESKRKDHLWLAEHGNN